jgi:hypothetical protein
MKKRKRSQKTRKKTRRQQKLAKLVKAGELAHGEAVPGDVLRSLTLDEQYTCSFEDYKAEVVDRKSGMIPWHRLPAEVWQEAHDNKSYISKLVQDRAIRPAVLGEEKEKLRWIDEAHPVDHRAPIPKALFSLFSFPLFGEREEEKKKPTFLLDRDQARILLEHVSVWEEVGSFLDRQQARFEMYWRDKPLQEFLDAFQGNFGLDNNEHTMRKTPDGSVYIAAYYLDRYKRYTVCILVPFSGLSGKTEKTGEEEKMIGPPVYYCYTCLCS